MKLNLTEKILMNNPLRAALHRSFEAKRLIAMGGKMKGGRALEVGCGQGVGAEIILDLFNADRVDSFDLDRQMVGLARHRLERRNDKCRLWAGDVTTIPVRDNTYDAVFDFGVIHHVPKWQDAVKELHRVLKPGGRLYAEEVLDRLIVHPLWKRLLAHPQANRFNVELFNEALTNAGFKVVESNELWKWFGWFVAEKV
ncbi:MAG: class I SAM-dependent methyltransferase [Proteobacteria bacterium]|nr:class I SAM-dependent methyltransferase [Pseudomonadota bacterium]